MNECNQWLQQLGYIPISTGEDSAPTNVAMDLESLYKLVSTGENNAINYTYCTETTTATGSGNDRTESSTTVTRLTAIAITAIAIASVVTYYYITRINRQK